MKKDIAIVLHNLVVFEQMKTIIDKYKDRIDLYIYIEGASKDEQWLAMAKDTFKFAKENDYNPKYLKEKPNKKYKILFTPILYSILPESEVNIKFNYGMGKDWLHSSSDIYFDYILCYGKRDAQFSEPFAKVLEVGAIKFYKIKKKKLKDKPTVLYLPTYGEYSSIESLYKPLEKLQKKYNIIVKLHHGTTFLEPDRVKLFENFDNVYDHKISMKKLFSEVDMVISDSSGAIYDSIATHTPVAIYDIKNYKLFNNKIESGEQVLFKNNLVNKFSDADKLEEVIKKTLKDPKKDEKLDRAFEIFFSCSPEVGIKRICNLIDDTLNGKIDLTIYKAAKSQLKTENDLAFLKNENAKLANENISLKNQLEYEKQVLEGILNSKSWKITKFLRRK